MHYLCALSNTSSRKRTVDTCITQLHQKEASARRTCSISKYENASKTGSAQATQIKKLRLVKALPSKGARRNEWSTKRKYIQGNRLCATSNNTDQISVTK